MERKIGEIFEYNGEWYQCMKGNTCNDCAFYRSSCGSLNDKGSCRYNFREDATNVIFKKLEKVGEPYRYVVYNRGVVMLQSYKLFTTPIINRVFCNVHYDFNTIDLEIKQTKEDMEESKFNLNPFDLQKAKQGKPVCTRDGRKARIICFDKKCLDGQVLIVLVDCGKEECMYFYTTDGKCIDEFSSFDLKMLPEKKEGWVNLTESLSHNPHILDVVWDTKEEALDFRRKAPINANIIATGKITWEE